MLSLLHLVRHVRVGGESSEYAAPNSDGTRPELLAYSREAEDVIGPSAPSKEPGPCLSTNGLARTLQVNDRLLQHRHYQGLCKG